MKAKAWQWIVLAAVSVLLVAGCGSYVESAGVVVPSPAPPPPAEVDITSPLPGPNYIWIGGVWVWAGNRWEWAKGRWELPPFLNATWVPSHCVNRDGKCIYIPGRWQ